MQKYLNENDKKILKKNMYNKNKYNNKAKNRSFKESFLEGPYGILEAIGTPTLLEDDVEQRFDLNELRSYDERNPEKRDKMLKSTAMLLSKKNIEESRIKSVPLWNEHNKGPADGEIIDYFIDKDNKLHVIAKISNMEMRRNIFYGRQTGVSFKYHKSVDKNGFAYGPVKFEHLAIVSEPFHDGCQVIGAVSKSGAMFQVFDFDFFFIFYLLISIWITIFCFAFFFFLYLITFVIFLIFYLVKYFFWI